jgi:hypothetical protein
MLTMFFLVAPAASRILIRLSSVWRVCTTRL